MQPAPTLSGEVTKWIHDIVQRYTDIREIWLLGSRANGTAKPTSDWDFLVLGGPGVRAALEAETDLHREDVDILVLDDETGEFSAVWGHAKTGSLSRWEWTLESEDSATYKATKWVSSTDDNEIPIAGANLGQQRVTRAKAFRVWSGDRGRARSDTFA